MTTPALDPASRDLIERVAAMTTAVPPDQLTLERRRSLSRDANALFLPPEGPLQVQRRDLRVPLGGRGLPARLYRPVVGWPRTAADDVLLVYFHGGGWVVGDLETHDNACAFLAQHLGCALLSVEYRKAPEHAYPAGCDDAADAYAWAASQLGVWDCKRIAVGGDSSGAHVAAYAMYANAAVATAAALLFYPVAGTDFSTESFVRTSAGPGFNGTAMRWYWQQFLGGADPGDDARAVPLCQRWGRIPPPTVLALAWHDPLYDEGMAYGQLLRGAGADVRIFDARDMAHGYLRQCRVNTAAQGHVEQVADALLNCLRPGAGHD